LPWSHRNAAGTHSQCPNGDANPVPDALPYSHSVGNTHLDLYSNIHQHHDSYTQPQHDSDQHTDKYSHSNRDTDSHTHHPSANPDPHTHFYANVYPFKYQYPLFARYVISYCDSMI
jgi:hypothetical protein